jgi:predicted Rossmann-fold nucleotide-binding protein
MNKTYAGIGSRSLTKNELHLCYNIGVYMAKQGWTLRTGAAQGANQAFANGALSVGGKVVLCLPWFSYESKWVESVCKVSAVIEILDHWHIEAQASVDQHHPSPDKLSNVVRKLHARNYLIIEPCRFILAFPKPGRDGKLGGTGQGIRIALSKGMDVLRLDEVADRKRVEKRIQ